MQHAIAAEGGSPGTESDENTPGCRVCVRTRKSRNIRIDFGIYQHAIVLILPKNLGSHADSVVLAEFVPAPDFQSGEQETPLTVRALAPVAAHSSIEQTPSSAATSRSAFKAVFEAAASGTWHYFSSLEGRGLLQSSLRPLAGYLALSNR